MSFSSEFATLRLGSHPVWTSLRRLTWRQRLALRWPYTNERQRPDRLLAFALTLITGYFIIRMVTPAELGETTFSVLTITWALVASSLMLLVHYLAQTTLEEMQVDPRFRFATTQDTPGFRLAAMYFLHVARDSTVQWTPELSVRVNEWVEGCWDTDTFRSEIVRATSPSKPLLSRWKMAQELVKSFAALGLPQPAGFETACQELITSQYREYVRVLRRQLVEQSTQFNDLHARIVESERELEALEDT